VEEFTMHGEERIQPVQERKKEDQRSGPAPSNPLEATLKTTEIDKV